MRKFWIIISVFWLWTCGGGGGGSSPTEPQEPAPVSNFTATPTTLIQGQAVTFTSTSTGTITSYAWNVDDDPAIEGTTATYTHTYEEVGTYSVTLTVTGPGGSNPKTAADMITVSTAAPTPTTETSQTVQEDGSTTISLTATDPNGQAVTFAITTDPTNGTATLSGTEITYTPNANFYGTDSVAYTASNGTYTSDPVTITITVEGQDDEPTTNDVSATTDEDTPVTLTLDATEIDGDNYSFSIVSQPTNGTLGSINGNQVEYTPNQDFNGTDTFTFEATDDRTYRRNVATATIIVNAVNDAPVANDITSQVTDENRAMQLDITLDATDVEGDALTYSIIGTNNGTVTVNGSTATYTPNQDWNGEDTFTYKANDGNLDSNTATVTVTVNAVNDAPETQDQSASTNEDTAVTITLSVVDVDTQQGMTRSIVSSPSNGSVVLSGSGNQTATYTPTTNWNGTDTFTWKANDGELDSNVSTVTITVAAVNDAPTTEDVSTTIDENRTASRSTGITLQGSDVDGDNLTYTVVSGPSNGNASIAGSILTYAANQDWNGTETITYKANDGTVDSNTSTVTITINSVNDAPVTQNVSFTTDEDTPYTESYTAYVSDVEGDNLTITTVTNPTNGTATCDDATNCTYTPNQDFNGTDSFTYKVNDGELDSNVSTVTVTVTAVNDAPVASAVSASTNEDTADNKITITGSDVDGDDITYILVSGPSNGSLASFPTNAFSTPYDALYTPNQDWNGTDTFTYKANDGTTDSNTATVTITVAAVNDAPIANDMSLSLDREGSIDFTLDASDQDGDSLSKSIVSQPDNGTLLPGAGLNYTYTPDSGYFGTDSFTYKVNDGTSDSDVKTVSFNIGEGSVRFGDENMDYFGLIRSSSSTNYLMAKGPENNKIYVYEFDDSLELLDDFTINISTNLNSFLYDYRGNSNGFNLNNNYNVIHGNTEFISLDNQLNISTEKATNAGELKDAKKLSNGNIMAVGWSQSSPNPFYPFMHISDSSGNTISETQFTSLGNSASWSQFLELSDGNYFLAFDDGCCAGRYVKMDPNLNLIWTTATYSGNRAARVTDALETQNLIITVTTHSQAQIRAHDLNGNQIWAQSYPKYFSYGQAHLTLHSSGDIIVATKSSQSTVGLLRIDINGNILWNKQYELPGTNHSDSNYSYFNNLAPLESSDGNLIVLYKNGRDGSGGKNGVYKVDASDGTKLLP